MTEFDRLHALVLEMDRKWQRLNQDIASGRRREARAREIVTARIPDPVAGVDYGTVSVDGNGVVVDISLDVDEVVRSNDEDVLSAIADALNSIGQNAVHRSDISEYEV